MAKKSAKSTKKEGLIAKNKSIPSISNEDAHEALEEMPLDTAVELFPVSMGGASADTESTLEVVPVAMEEPAVPEETEELAAPEEAEGSLEEDKGENESKPALVEVETPRQESSAPEGGGGRREVMRSAVLVGLGNLGSSVLGLFRQSFVLAPGPQISAPFFLALSPAQKFNDFLVNGSVQGALVPTFNDFAEDREALRRLVFTIVNLVVVVMAIASLGYFFISSWFMGHFLASGLSHDEQLRAIQFSQIIFLSLLALGPFAVLQAALYAQKEFGWTAFATSAYHAGIIVGATATTLLIGTRFSNLGQYGLAIGVILGAVGEIALLIPGMRNQHMRYMFVLDIKHPALKKILLLYAPVAFSFFLSAAFAFLDSSFQAKSPCLAFMQHTSKAECGSLTVTAMQAATFLIQFPGGLVSSALAFAVLPTLTTFIREDNIERFKNTLLLGFRLGLLLMIPAMAGLIVLQLPIVRLLFEHGKVTNDQVLLTATSLQYYSFQLPFLAIDQLLIAAFYARKSTLIPSIYAYGIGAICYLIVALPFWHSYGAIALAIANTVQNSVHAIFLLIVLRRVVGSLHLRSMLPALGRILLATAVLVVVAWGLQWLLAQTHMYIFSLDDFIGRLIVVVVAGGAAAIAYFAAAIALKIDEVALLKGALLSKLGKR